MNILILQEFIKIFGNKDIDKSFKELKEFKRLKLYETKGE